MQAKAWRFWALGLFLATSLAACGGEELLDDEMNSEGEERQAAYSQPGCTHDTCSRYKATVSFDAAGQYFQRTSPEPDITLGYFKSARDMLQYYSESVYKKMTASVTARYDCYDGAKTKNFTVTVAGASFLEFVHPSPGRAFGGIRVPWLDVGGYPEDQQRINCDCQKKMDTCKKCASGAFGWSCDATRTECQICKSDWGCVPQDACFLTI